MNMEKTIKAGIVGGTGYTGVELMRLLLGHPHVEIACVTSRTDAGKSIATIYPHLTDLLDLAFIEPEIETLGSCDVVFFATPHGIALEMSQPLLEQGVLVIDLSPDFRLKDIVCWEHWYGQKHTQPELLKTAVYGLPEVNRKAISSASLIACPGCYPTAVQLGFLPLLEAGLVDLGELIADVKSGVSGAGRKAAISGLMSESGEGVKAYAASGHRHLPEIVAGLEAVTGETVGLTFVPHLMPMIRGIHATLYSKLTTKISLSEIQAIYQQRYVDESFVTVLPVNSHPDSQDVRMSNRCQIAIHQPQGAEVIVVLSVIDNLVKGAAGQAVQNMNLMFGYAETAGLDSIACYP
ncbi:MAG TPA: N-acetyl-gamma-glutamyl-phosphate reductase [Crenotrichaceae bacterium]|nr:N-acetyl-gamma-glutamyl-phosphate reductase [Crenotrichaceae bacterium]